MTNEQALRDKLQMVRERLMDEGHNCGKVFRSGIGFRMIVDNRRVFVYWHSLKGDLVHIDVPGGPDCIVSSVPAYVATMMLHLVEEYNA